MRAALYSRVSTADQQTLDLQINSMRNFCRARRWEVAIEIQEIGSGAKKRPEREQILKLARQRQIDCIIVWKLDRFGRSLSDLVKTLEELKELNVSFVSITESLDFTTAPGRALAGMLSVFAEFERDILRERVSAGIRASRERGTKHGRPATAPITLDKIRELVAQTDADGNRKFNNSQIAKKLKVSRAVVIRELKKH